MMLDDVPLLIKLIKGYLSDVDIVWQDIERIRRLQDKRLRKVVRYAYTVPLYHNKYKTAGINPGDIRGVEDIRKLPVVTKDDIRNSFPKGVLPEGYNTRRAEKLSTSGSTGKPITIYVDRFSILQSIIAYVRILKAYGERWDKTRITIIADTTYGSAGYATFNSPLPSFLMKILPIDNIQILDITEKSEEMIAKINDFKPDFLNGYPGVLHALATLKMEKGFGRDINPRYVSSSGAVLDPFTRRYISEAFDAHVFDVYESTEGGPMAFECRRGCYHLHSDMVYLEALDDDMNPVSSGEVGRVAVTKLYGKGTPVVRYVGMGDLVKWTDDVCDCGINTGCIGSIEGRRVDAIVTADGGIIPPLSITGVPNEVMSEEKHFCVKQFQIVQEENGNVTVLVVPKKDEKNKEKTVIVYHKIETELNERIGGGISVQIKEVDEIPTYGAVLPPLVVSKVKKTS